MSTPDLPLRMKQLKLHGMASQWPELLAKAQLHAMAPEHWMVELLQAESAERHVRAQANQMKAARFPVHRDLLGFEFSGAGQGVSQNQSAFGVGVEHFNRKTA